MLYLPKSSRAQHVRLSIPQTDLYVPFLQSLCGQSVQGGNLCLLTDHAGVVEKCSLSYKIDREPVD